ncbi:hypothetical protein ACJJIC_16895 [Microbulbifer sp. ANSA002]
MEGCNKQGLEIFFFSAVTNHYAVMQLAMVLA